ncbi:hypothetical protein [Burkholderia plantarii]|uniref:hypothetical protein n=1 Tax=Burkholderia plantarii TaxID=41899 RepID=UPI0018DDBF2B|nr:hypothetical protein [Burkholderia plantarii]MBI0326029.1 hypothetical protein [Burkholderia plantarii]
MLDRLKRFAHRHGMLRRHKKIKAAPAIYALDAEFDTTWHGDHWQNLLASPLDARHYVMEDWAQPACMPSAREVADPKPTKRPLRG